MTAHTALPPKRAIGPTYSELSVESLSIFDDFPDGTPACYEFRWANILHSANTRVKKIELFRSTAGETNVLYKVGTITNNPGASAATLNERFDDDTLNASTGDDILLVLADPPLDLTLIGRRQVPPPTDMAYVAMFQDRYFYFGIVKYNRGTVSVTNGSATITGSGTDWTEDMVGRYIEIEGESQANLRINARASATSFTLADEGGTAINIDRASASGLSYVVVPEKSRRRQILYSYQDEPESVPETNSITLQENAGDDDEIVGAMPYGPYLYILSQRHKYSLSYTRDPATDGSVRFLDDRGAFNHYCWDIFENMAYLMDDSGCYSFDGKESKTISAAIQDYWRQDGSGDKIDFTKSKNFFVKCDRPKERVYFFVSFTGDADTLPTRALVFNIRRQTFDPMHYPVQIAGASMVEKDGETRLVFGAENEKVHLVDEGTTDVVTSEQLGTSNASSTASTLQVADTTFTSAMVGASVYIYEGTGKGQRRSISSFSSGTVVGIAPNWGAGLTPDATSKFVVGAIEWNWKSSSFPIPETDERSSRAVEVKFKPTGGIQSADLRLYYNGLTTPDTHEMPLTEGDAVEIRETNKEDVVFRMQKTPDDSLSDSTGREVYRFGSTNSMSGQGDHQLAIELRGYSADDAQEIQEINIEGVGEVGGE